MMKIIIILQRSLAVFFKVIYRSLSVFWKMLSACQRVVFNLAFLLMIVFFLTAYLMGTAEDEIPSDAALVLAPSGNIVIQKTYEEPMAAFLDRSQGEEKKRETLLRDILDSIDYAREDERIKLLVLDLKNMGGAGINKLQEIGAALKQFKQSGKKIIAMGGNYNQNQYYLAAHADEILLHPHGMVSLSGYGVYRSYFKEALAKLMVQFHVFKVGAYKAAIEPFIRNDMSPEAKESNLAWLKVLWSAYQTDVTTLRNLDSGALDDYINNINKHLRVVKGDSAKLALNHKLADQLKTRHQMRKQLIALVGEDETGTTYKQIHFTNYINAIRPEKENIRPDADKIGVIAARGMILDGKQPAGKIGSQSLVNLIRKARDSEKIKALVIHIDSGGGSAFASEIIRSEIEMTRKAGKPVIVSMSSVAASGAYWIASSADEIWASETTITGSIGIFAALPTFEKSLQYLGVHNDGVGTTELADGYNPARPLNPVLSDAIQQIIENGYHRFINLVASGRNMTPEEVAKVAQGRVWDGLAAHKLGLVDKLGGLKEAVASAADKAGVNDYDILYIEKPLTFTEELAKQITEKVQIVWERDLQQSSLPEFLSLLRYINADVEKVAQLNDPNGLYALCLACDIQ
ncbi:signal peptide peptidase SppA [Desulfococcaceae bacterium HSG9]|nr:signal peptide peptidase SppA [Desulfococcaceae bacterium HSG9]